MNKLYEYQGEQFKVEQTGERSIMVSGDKFVVTISWNVVSQEFEGIALDIGTAYGEQSIEQAVKSACQSIIDHRESSGVMPPEDVEQAIREFMDGL